jgi:hypothetical protein
MTDEAAFLPQFAIRTLINQELTITKPMEKAKKKKLVLRGKAG